MKPAVRVVAHDGERMSVEEAAQRFGVTRHTIRERWRAGKPLDRIVAASRPRRVWLRASATMRVETLVIPASVPGALSTPLSLDDCACLTMETLVTFEGKTLSLRAWAQHAGLPPVALLARLRACWPFDEALAPLTRVLSRLSTDDAWQRRR